MKLYLVHSPSSRSRIVNCNTSNSSLFSVGEISSSWLHRNCSEDARYAISAKVIQAEMALKPEEWHNISVATKQAVFYTSELAEQIRQQADIAIVWPPERRDANDLANRNRPPTRLLFWMAHGVPVFGYPMPSYVDVAQSNGYPAELLNVTSIDQISAVIMQMQSPDVRRCLQHQAQLVSRSRSPIASALQLLAIIQKFTCLS